MAIAVSSVSLDKKTLVCLKFFKSIIELHKIGHTMNVINLKKILFISLLTSMVAIAGCEKDGPMERAGESIDNATEDADDALDDATEDAGDALGDVADDIKDATN